MLEGQLETILGYIGNPQGELFASAMAVQRLEQNVTKQQVVLDTVEKQVQVFTKDLREYLDELLKQAGGQRGSRSADFQTILHFMSSTLATAIAKIQQDIHSLIQDLIPVKKIQDFERQILMAKQTGTASTAFRQQMDDPRVSQLESRLFLLEQGSRKPTTAEVSTAVQRTMDEVTARLDNLEKQLVAAVERAQRNPRQQDSGGPLAQLQARVEVLNSEFQSFRGSQQLKLLESMLTTSIANTRQTLEQQMTNYVPTERLESVQREIQRVDQFAREVLTGFTRVKQDHESIKQSVEQTLTPERLDELRQMRDALTALGEELKSEVATSRVLTNQFNKVNKTLADLREENEARIEAWLANRMEAAQESFKVMNEKKLVQLKYDLAHDVETVVKGDFERFFNTKSVALIKDHVEHEMPPKVQRMVTDHIQTYELVNKSEFFSLKKDISKNVDGIRTNGEALEAFKLRVSQQVDMFVQQFEHFGKLILANQTETGKLNKQVQNLSLQIKELHVTISTDQKRFEKQILGLLEQLREERVNGYLQQLEQKQKPLTLPPPQQTATPTNTKKAELLYKSLTKCFYTAIFGSSLDAVDTLGNFDKIPGWDYICFTNLDFPGHKGWKCIKVDQSYRDPAVASKFYKWMSHKMLLDYDVVVWMDGYMSPNPMYSELLQHWILSMREQGHLIAHRPHDVRKCVWEECDAVLTSKRARPQDVERTRRTLEAYQMPKAWGLFDTNVLIKFHKNTVLQHLCEQIFEQLQVCNRDQLAVTPVYYKNNFTAFQLQNLIRIVDKTGEHKRIDAF